jgi:hypothetical protein
MEWLADMVNHRIERDDQSALIISYDRTRSE